VPLRETDVTVAEVLKTAGYTTGITGKWGLGEPDTTGTPNRQGFDQWFGYLNQRRAHTYYPTFLWRNELKYELPGNANGGQEQYTHDMFTEFALDFIRHNKQGPFFLYLPYTIPHSKLEVPSLEPYADRQWPAPAKAYAAMITRLDRDIGHLMGLLQERKMDESTIVFFCSDNGAANRYEGLFDSSGPLRGRKRDMYEGGLRTPMVVRWPGEVPAGTTSDTVWTFADFLPTAAELADVRPPAGIDGVSVLPTLLGRSQDLSDRMLYWEFFERGFQQAARWKNWKAIRPKIGGPLELYDLTTDLGETNNVAGQHPDVVKRIERFLQSARTESTAWPVPQTR
jgi:arylsulfatase A-like enzyme